MTQGNRLTGPEVLDQVIQSMHGSEQLSLAERLVKAIQAGAAAGGDRKGERSVNIMVFGPEEYPICDIRIDDHEQPMRELSRLFLLYQRDVLPEVLKLPRRDQVPEPQLEGGK